MNFVFNKFKNNNNLACNENEFDRNVIADL